MKGYITERVLMVLVGAAFASTMVLPSLVVLAYIDRGTQTIGGEWLLAAMLVVAIMCSVYLVVANGINAAYDAGYASGRRKGGRQE